MNNIVPSYIHDEPRIKFAQGILYTTLNPCDDVSPFNMTTDRYQEGYDAGFERGCSVGAEMARGANDLQNDFDSLYEETGTLDESRIITMMADFLIMVGGHDYGWETREDVIQCFKRLLK